MGYYYYYYYDEEVEEEQKHNVDQEEVGLRISIRAELTEHNKSLSEAAKKAGVEKPWDFVRFHNSGYQGLYDGMDKKALRKHKGLEANQEPLDYMGSTELAANLFRATQTEEKLKREQIQCKKAANTAHKEVGEKVREIIKDLGGTMPEDLLTPDKGIKQVKREMKKK